MTPQEIYDKVYTHFVIEDNPLAVNGDGYIYVFEDEFGNVHKCAVGLLIPQNIYSSNIEGLDAYGLSEDFPEVYDSIPFSSKDIDKLQFLLRLQQTHDSSSEETKKEDFQNFAEYWDLNPVPQSFS